MYAKLENDQLVAFGLTLDDVRSELPNVIIPSDPDGLLPDLSHLGYPIVKPTKPPQTQRWQSVQEVQPVWIAGELTQQFTLLDMPLTLADKRDEIRRDADLIARLKRDQVVAGISAAEMASWPIKRTEALAFQASGAAADAPNLAAEATARGISLPDLVAKVMNKSARLAALEAAIAGRCGAIQDAAAVAQSTAALRSIDLDAGWPV
ncbi:MAG: hypothetical protein JSR83_03880 [Proteobacteria bacterium]|nr:hypothetical protein [Pseudomonadota bacterium]